MTTGETDSSVKDQPALHVFVERASGRLANIRNGILIFDQDRSSDDDIELSMRNLQLLSRDAVENDRIDVVELAQNCESSLRSLLKSEPSPSDIGRCLDLVAGIEERLLKIPLNDDDFLRDISGFVESSFDFLKTEVPAYEGSDEFEEFEVDEETLEIFRSEAGELLENIKENVGRLNAAADDKEALWEVRRNAHTFKGAAGIVGLKAASELAHRVEDLLDKMVESNAVVYSEIVSLLSRSSERLEVITLGTGLEDEAGPIEDLYAEFDALMSAVPAKRTSAEPPQPPAPASRDAAPKEEAQSARPASTPIVRVSLDRLDDLIKLARDLTVNRSDLVERFAELTELAPETSTGGILVKLGSLLDAQRCLTNEMQEKLFRIRMVRFGTLETRLSRAVHVTCQEENKKASVTVNNGDCEVDTQVIDALIEPLLHLLKNAVVHGIETEDTRRLIGKPEKGSITIDVDSDESGVTLIVKDDGRGISASKLKHKAVADQIIAPETAEKMSESEAFDLIFHRGLTTADTVNLNAGRGVGMSIVKESIEFHGGSVAIVSEPQKGTTFTLRMPLSIKKADVRERALPPPAIEIKPVEHASKLILVVDDSASIRRQTSRVVEDAGYRVITSGNGAEAMELLLSNVWRPDLILSDVEMPQMDGWEFLECVKNTDELSDIPVIMVTSLDEAEHRQRANDLGAADYNVKPVNGTSLLDSISRTLEAAV